VIVVGRAPPRHNIIVIVNYCYYCFVIVLLLFLLFSLSFLFSAPTTPAHGMYYNDTKIMGGLYRLAIEAAAY